MRERTAQPIALRSATRGFSILLLLLTPLSSLGKCLPISEAPKRVGETACITGKVLKVGESKRSGTMFLNFCDDYRKCPFSVVVFPSDLKDVGDVRWLEGKEIEIHGKIKLYQGQAEMVLKDVSQLSGEGAKLPLVPKTYDVERQGKFSAGQFHAKKAKAPKDTRDKRSPSDAEAEPDPQ